MILLITKSIVRGKAVSPNEVLCCYHVVIMPSLANLKQIIEFHHNYHSIQRVWMGSLEQSVKSLLWVFASVAGDDGSDGGSVTAPPGFEVLYSLKMMFYLH